ncbi:MAG: pyridoxal phosphate-dependent aminotransferase [Acidobacteria bacterium]|nr:pyridoxal phosphate-dependent aminotransferase [Acidobacteriota bacterium]
MEIVNRLARISPSATLAAADKAARMAAQGLDVIDLGQGLPDFPTPPQICDAGITAINEGRTRYTPAAGIPELRDAIAARYRALYGVEYERAETIVTCGGKHALYSAFQALVEDGDEVVIPTPYWVSFPEQVRIAGGRPVFVDAREEDAFVVSAQDIDDACTERTKAIILNTPSNPSGAVIPPSVLADIARIAIDRDLVIVFDETYEQFLYDGAVHGSPLGLGPEAKPVTLSIGSCSKTWAMTGWRIGWAIGPRELVSAMARLQSHLTSNPTSISQWAAVEALTGDQTAVSEMLAAFAERREVVLRQLRSMSGVSCGRPMGAFYAFPSVGGILGDSIATSDDLATHLIDTANVVTVPGTAFGRDGFLRISFAVENDRLGEALDRMANSFAALGT